MNNHWPLAFLAPLIYFMKDGILVRIFPEHIINLEKKSFNDDANSIFVYIFQRIWQTKTLVRQPYQHFGSWSMILLNRDNKNSWMNNLMAAISNYLNK